MRLQMLYELCVTEGTFVKYVFSILSSYYLIYLNKVANLSSS